MAADACPVCDLQLTSAYEIGGAQVFDCKRCGTWMGIPNHNYAIPFPEALCPGDERRNLRRKAQLSRIIRRGQVPAKHFGVRVDFLDGWNLDAPLSSPYEQIDDLILWIGQNQLSPIEPARWNLDALSAYAGCALDADRSRSPLTWLLSSIEFQKLCEVSAYENDSLFKLTMDGWQQYHQLLQDEGDSHFAFMAMKFGDPQLDEVFTTCFVPAVEKTGFELRRLIDGQGAGLIDDQMRIGIRTSRFVISDLTHNNSGAYWEAGFAEGLGKPVIYTCRRAEWEEQSTHFDTNHLVTIIWDPADLDDTSERLKATIRATLPDEVYLTD